MPSWNRHRPVRMRAIKIAVLIHHLGLDPDPELQPCPVDLVHKISKRASEFFFINIPVAEAAAVIIAFSEPAIIHDQHLNPKILCAHREIKQLFLIEIKIAGLPAVQEDRPDPVTPFSPADMPARTPVEILGQACHPLGRVTHHNLRCPEYITSSQRVSEQLIGQPQQHAEVVVLILLNLSLEAA